MWNRFTHNILTIDSHVCRLAQMRPRVAQKTFGHKLPSNLIPMSHWAGDIFMLTFPDAANNQAVWVDLIRVRENNCSCSENCQNICPNLCDCCYQLSACQLLTVVNQHSSIIEICDLSHWLCPFDMQLMCLYKQSVRPTICLVSNLSSSTL